MERVLSIVWLAIQVIFKTWPEQNRANNVLKTRSPTSAECRLVMVVRLVKKAMLEVPNAPVVTPVNQGRVTGAHVKNVRRVNLVHPMIKTLLRAHCAKLACIKTKEAKHLVYRAYLARMLHFLHSVEPVSFSYVPGMHGKQDAWPVLV